jgi:penicillin G amidase
MLARRKGLTPQDMLHMQLDVQSDMDQAIAQRLAYALDHASAKALSGDKDRLHEAADLLRSFDGNMAADSPAAAVEWTIRRRLPVLLIEAAIRQHDGDATSASKAATLAGLYLWREDGSALESIIAHQPARWLPAGYPNWNDFLASAVEDALKGAGAPPKLAGWSLGAIHRMSIEHPVLAMIPGLPRMLGVSAGSGLRPIGGYRETVRASDPHFGSSERFTADMSAPMDSAGGAIANITTGESGNPRSPYYLDQMDAWFAGTTFPLASEANHTLTLEPR